MQKENLSQRTAETLQKMILKEQPEDRAADAPAPDAPDSEDSAADAPTQDV